MSLLAINDKDHIEIRVELASFYNCSEFEFKRVGDLEGLTRISKRRGQVKAVVVVFLTRNLQRQKRHRGEVLRLIVLNDYFVFGEGNRCWARVESRNRI